MADLAQPSPAAKAPATPPPGYNILFVLVDQEHHFDKWPFPVPGREYLKEVRHDVRQSPGSDAGVLVGAFGYLYRPAYSAHWRL